jgi:peptide deformylase
MAIIIPGRLKLTHKVLHNVARPIEPQDDPRQIRMLSEKMHRFMHDNDAIGLAAPQVGISRRIFVMNVNGVARTCINPELQDPTTDQLFEFEEGCLSFSGEMITLSRPRKIWARYREVDGSWQECELSELEATCYQHELDHLDGITMHDRKNDQG